jgi:hypothetical protein
MKNILIGITIVMLTGCFLGYDRPTYIDDFTSLYFNNIYISRIDNYIIKFSEISVIASDSRNLSERTIFDVYQDEKHECYLFSFSWNDLLKLSKEHFSNKINKMPPIYIIEKDKLNIITRTEYDLIKTTLKPHPYDPSLCRPKPADR